MAYTPYRSSRSVVPSLNQNRVVPRTDVVLLAEWCDETNGASTSTIPPMDSSSWLKLSKFQRGLYEWLIYKHQLPIAGKIENLRAQPPLPTRDDYKGYRPDEDVGSGINAYDEAGEEEEQKRVLIDSPSNDAFEKDVYSPYVRGMDARLAQFVSHHNVNMTDGAVIYPASADNRTANKKKSFTAPCGCTRQQFAWAICGITTIILAIVAMSVCLGVIFGAIKPLDFPEGEPWWTHGLVYQIHVPTFANDANGIIGRLKDVTSRIVYLTDKIYATAAILTGMLDADNNGVRNWKAINPDINSEGDSVEALLTGLNSMSSDNIIQLMLGMPLYATSERHSWFAQSVSLKPQRLANFYLWRREPPINAIESRYYAFNSVRNEYYRHVHGNPALPLLNLSDPEVQTEMISVVAFWKEALGISGIFITNSTNVLPEMAAPLTTILASGLDTATGHFTWFADNPNADKLLTGKPLCYYEVIDNERITTRTEDISSQIYSILPEIQQRSCSPVWRLEQRSADFTDYFTLQKFVAFLPGLTVMKAGEEVQLMTGSTELIQWDFTDPADFKTYWPINVLPDETSDQRLKEWGRYGIRILGEPKSIFKTAWNTNDVKIRPIPRTENLFVVERVYLQNQGHVATFSVSFQALNAFTNLADVVISPDGSSVVSLVYESRGLFTGNSLQLEWVYLVNNDVIVTLT